MKKSILQVTLFVSAALAFAAQSSLAESVIPQTYAPKQPPAAAAPAQPAHAPSTDGATNDFVGEYNQPDTSQPAGYGGSAAPASAAQAQHKGLTEIQKLKAEIARLKRLNALYKKQAAQSCEQATVSENDVKHVVPTGASATGQNDGASGSAGDSGDGYSFTLGGGPAPIFTLPPGALNGGNANGGDQYPSTR
jgi:hypothetical protein